MKFTEKLRLIWIKFLINTKRGSISVIERGLNKKFNKSDYDSLLNYKSSLRSLYIRKAELIGGVKQ